MREAVGTFTQQEVFMSKPRDVKKNVKKQPQKTLKEKRLEQFSRDISKPGGLTTSECLALGLPMIVVSPIPGQEERNADYLLENGAALKAHDAAGLEFRVQELL
jgi:UDP-N-acetylglucosamine:LPS N-acetylglucosamine transferase